MDFSSSLKIAWRNIWRSKTRSVLTFLAVAFCTMVLVFFIALQLSSYDTSINATVRVFYGHLQIQREGYLAEPSMRKALKEVDAVLERIENLPGVAAVGARGTAFALVSSEQRSYGTQIIGVDPRREPQLSTISGVIRQGAYFSSDSAQEAVLGKSLARNLHVEIGDELTLLGQGWDGSLAASVINVVGIFESGSNDIDRSMIHVPLKTFQEIFSMPGQAHSIVIAAESLDIVEKLQKSIAGEISNFDSSVVLSWEDIVPGLKESIELDMASGWLFYFSLVIIVGFSILNTFWMSVLERTREFGIMLALGTKPGRISLMILIECLLLTLIGIILGVIFGGIIVMYFGHYGFSVPGSEEIMKMWNVPAVIYPRITLASISIGPLILISIALLATIYPAIKVFDLNPIEAINDR